MFNSQAPKSDDLPSSAQLLKSTIISAVVAGVLLVTVVLPSEYAIDPTGIGATLGLTAMGEIKTQLAEEAEIDRQNAGTPTVGNDKPVQTGTTPLEGSSLLDRIVREFGISAAYAQEVRKDEISVTLQPGEGAEVKLAMSKGAKANFTWTATDKVNFDLHGDGGGESTSYEKGRGVAQDNGVLEAAFDGNHGWFWRNRTSAPVTVTLKADGAYTDIKRVM
ncbi:transmembrane anchor protein [Shinella sp. 838]|jgi:hypothetical protein|uniref:hypothetical protein n=1 Tax=unclassified Shinella TaxID=2643062 RepID=UPI000437B079|nr:MULTISPECIES: hypothetical protein [unclassified Shinella]EYR77585.1 hypothetical protein SHLA_47c000350 [Shinella sp. DD12]MCA0344416.1 transmembrane anchor protein [Pseudomonadota bacterium]MDG4673710.1 transmembrane anchor protein [Shinella sp. 838]